MGSFSIWHWLIVLALVLVLFGRGRVADVMGEFGKGLKSFKQGMADETTERPVTPPPAQIPASPQPDATLNGETKVEPGQSQSQ